MHDDHGQHGGADAVGAPRRRLEDERLLRGAGCYIADIALPGQLHAVFLRSPHAHASIRSIDIDEARAIPGVHAILTGREVADDRLGGIPWEVRPSVDDPAMQSAPLGAPEVAPPQPLMAQETVRYVGEIVAMVVADSVDAALDAAEAIEVAFEERPAYASITAALDCAGDPIWPQFPGNVGFVLRRGDPAATESAFDRAAYVETLRWSNNRIAGGSIETRGYIGDYDADRDLTIVHASAGKPHSVRDTMAKFIFGITNDRIVVKVPDVGGGFGAKNVLYPEQCLVAWAARRLGRPVRWISRRDEAIATDIGARDQIGETAAAFDETGLIIGLRVRAAGALGAYLSPRGIVPLRNAGSVCGSFYDIPAFDFEMKCVFTNTTPTCSFRGAGQPEGIFPIERLIDRAAEPLGIDRVDLRRRNLIPASAMPYTVPLGMTYDSGDFDIVMETMLGAADVADFRARQAESERSGRLRGWGMANAIEMCGFGYDEQTELVCLPDGTIELLIGTQSSGQGHATVYAQIAAERLGVPAARIRVRQGDTGRIEMGNGTGASRSLSVGGSATVLAADALIERGRVRAADLLEAAIEDVQYNAGTFEIVGTDRRLTLAALASEAEADPLSVKEKYMPPDGSFPNGSHICEVEVDSETGSVDIVRYGVCQDVGRAVNPMIIEGQIEGGVALGIGQAICEHLIYDDETGQLVTGSFVDYAITRATDVPNFTVNIAEIPSTNNLLGAKGVGESGALGAPPAVVNAVLHAVAPLGVTDLDMPLTPNKVWHAIREARERRA